MRDPSLYAQRLILSALCHLARQNFSSTLAIEEIADSAGFCERYTAETLRRLAAAGCISKKRDGARGHTYTINWPAVASQGLLDD